MLQPKFLVLLLTPALIFSLFGVLSINNGSTISVHRSVIQAKPSPVVLPQRVSSVIPVETGVTSDSSVQTPEVASTPAVSSAPNTSPKSPAPKITTSTTSVTPAPKPAPAPAPSCSGSFSQEFLCLLNQYRASQGKGRLSYSSSLSSVALSYSSWMNSTGSFSHVGPNGERAWDRCAAAGTSCLAENLALGATSAQNLFNMWKNSAGHNANLLGSYSTIGLGVSGSYTTALFN